MNVDEVANIFQGTITKEEILEIQHEVQKDLIQKVKKMCNYSEVCIMFGEAKGEERGIKIGEERGIKIGEEKGIKIGEEKGRKSTIKLLLNTEVF